METSLQLVGLKHLQCPTSGLSIFMQLSKKEKMEIFHGREVMGKKMPPGGLTLI